METGLHYQKKPSLAVENWVFCASLPLSLAKTIGEDGDIKCWRIVGKQTKLVMALAHLLDVGGNLL